MSLEDRPCKDNVKEEDFLVSDFVNKRVLLPIKRIDDNGVFADGVRLDYCSFENAVILTQRGNYLVGEEVIKNSRNREP